MKIIFLLVFGFSISDIKAQTEVDNGIFVSFPCESNYKLKDNNAIYDCKTENAYYIVVILKNVIADYPEYTLRCKNTSKAQIISYEDELVSGVIKGILEYTNNEGVVENKNVGSFLGKKVKYSAINPANGLRGKRVSHVILVRDKIIDIKCMYFNNSENTENEVNKYFSSIVSK